MKGLGNGGGPGDVNRDSGGGGGGLNDNDGGNARNGNHLGHDNPQSIELDNAHGNRQNNEVDNGYGTPEIIGLGNGLNNGDNSQSNELNNDQRVYERSEGKSIHRQQYPYTVCNSSYTRKDVLKRHIETKHLGVKFSCLLCDKSFTRKYKLMAHERLHHASSNTPAEEEQPASHVSSSTPAEQAMDTEEQHSPSVSSDSTNQSQLKSPPLQVKSQTPTSSENTENESPLPDPDQTTSSPSHRFSCRVCGKVFTRLTNRARYMRISHGKQRVPCEKCDRIFTRRDTLKTHMQNVHVSNRLPCNKCDRTFRDKKALQVHMRKHGDKPVEKLSCQHCGEEFTSRMNLKRHAKECTHLEVPNAEVRESAHGRHAIRYRIEPPTRFDFHLSLIESLNSVVKLLTKELMGKGGIKWALVAECDMSIRDGENLESVVRFLRSENQRSLQSEDLQHHVEIAIMSVLQAFDKCRDAGSEFLLNGVNALDLEVATYHPLEGSSHVELPRWLRNPKKGFINVKNQDEKCFLWSVLAHIHPAPHHPDRVQNYEHHQGSVNVDDLRFPVPLTDISKFEKNNPGISINVFGLEDSKYIIPLRITSLNRPVHINPLRIEDDFTSHYVLIANKDRFLWHLRKVNRRVWWCDYCLHAFSRQDLHDKHRVNCLVHGPQVTKLLNPDINIFKFSDYEKCLPHDYIIVADFETILVPLQTCSPNLSTSFSYKTSQHVPCGYSYVVIDRDGKIVGQPVVHHATSNVARTFLLKLEEEMKKIQEARVVYPIHMTEQDELNFQSATHCHICKGVLGSERVRDHDHYKPLNNLRGAAHKACNVKMAKRDYIPCFLHNLTNYDAHLIILALSEVAESTKDITVIPRTKEKYISFSWKKLRFLDSYQFLPTSLEKLVQDLTDEEMCILRSEFPDESQRKLLRRKEVYCYDYMTDFDIFYDKQLPAKENFFNKLTDSHIADADYSHAQNVWQTFKMTSLWDYHDLYLLTDVLLLSDVIQNFRKVCLKDYGLDPAHFYTTPGLSLSAALLKTGIEFELLTDVDMHLMVESGIRGGVSTINHRYAKANNRYIEDTYNPSEEETYIIPLDANNLYGLAQSQALPVGGFRWLSEDEIAEFDITSVNEDDEQAFILEVDLKYCASLHDAHNDFPLAPENIFITEEMLSPYQREIMEKCKIKSVDKVKKLTPNLRDKDHYIIHSSTLKLYTNLSMQLTNIHRGIAFRQAKWLEPYIAFNTQKRQQSKSKVYLSYLTTVALVNS